MLALECSDKSAKDHVNRGGVEGRCDEDEDGLDDEAAERELVVVTPYSSSVANSLDWELMNR